MSNTTLLIRTTEVSDNQHLSFNSAVDTNEDVIQSFITRLFNLEAGQTA